MSVSTCGGLIHRGGLYSDVYGIITLVSFVIINHNSQNLRWLVLLMPGGFKVMQA